MCVYSNTKNLKAESYIMEPDFISENLTSIPIKIYIFFPSHSRQGMSTQEFEFTCYTYIDADSMCPYAWLTFDNPPQKYSPTPRGMASLLYHFYSHTKCIKIPTHNNDIMKRSISSLCTYIKIVILYEIILRVIIKQRCFENFFYLLYISNWYSIPIIRTRGK